MTSTRRTAGAPAKLNLALVVGPLRPDGKHEVATLLQRLELADEITVWPADRVTVEGFADDTLVRAGLEEIERHSGRAHAARIQKEIPVAGGLGGGSSDAATALLLANELLDDQLAPHDLYEIAAGLGSDVPFFLFDGPQLGLGEGSELVPQAVPQDFTVVLALPVDAEKESTAAVYRSFDERSGALGFQDRRQRLLDGLRSLDTALDLAGLPGNDLASSPVAAQLVERGAFRADVSGAGPIVYGLFADPDAAAAAATALVDVARTWITRPRWYR